MDPSRTLFALQTPCRWFPDETLYSLCSRHHRAAGNVGAGRTSLELFGPSHLSGSRLGGLEALSTRAGGQLGSAASIVQERTLHPFFQAFMPASSASRVVDAMLCGTPGGLRHALDCDLDGLVPRHALRACLQCAKEDLETRQVAYWHRNHQWPGVYRCHRHGLALFEVVHRPMHERGFAWLLPSIEGMKEAREAHEAHEAEYPLVAASGSAPATPRTPLQPDTSLAHRARSDSPVAYTIPAPLTQEEDETVIRRHAAMALAIGQHGHRMHLEGLVLADLYRMLLSRRGLISASSGLPRVPAAGEQLLASALPMLRLRDFASKLQTKEQANEHVRRLVTPKRLPRDPLWHLLAMTWLAKDWDAFVRQYEAIARLRAGSGSGSGSADFWNQPLRI